MNSSDMFTNHSVLDTKICSTNMNPLMKPAELE